LRWPAQSPDLNPIENLWAIVKRDVAAKKPKNVKELEAAIKESWDSIPVELCQKLALSFIKRRDAVLAAKGLYTRW